MLKTNMPLMIHNVLPTLFQFSPFFAITTTLFKQQNIKGLDLKGICPIF